MTKPTTVPTFCTTGTREAVPAGIISSGWLPNDQPPAEYLNQLHGLTGDWFTWINTLQKGDAYTSYSDSFAQGQLDDHMRPVALLHQLYDTSGTMVTPWDATGVASTTASGNRIDTGVTGWTDGEMIRLTGTPPGGLTTDCIYRVYNSSGTYIQCQEYFGGAVATFAAGTSITVHHVYYNITIPSDGWYDVVGTFRAETAGGSDPLVLVMGLWVDWAGSGAEDVATRISMGAGAEIAGNVILPPRQYTAGQTIMMCSYFTDCSGTGLAYVTAAELSVFERP